MAHYTSFFYPKDKWPIQAKYQFDRFLPCYTVKMVPISIYIHVPFCLHRCGYCDFTTYAGLEDLIPSYTEALCCEINRLASAYSAKLEVGTVYFGGGTPSLLPADHIVRVLSTLRNSFEFILPVEVSLEANPGTVSREYLLQLQSAGVNRLSLGMQSANEDELTILERQHNLDDVLKAVEWSRAAGFTNLNLDLIFGLPDQGLHTWIHTLNIALSMHPQHLSLYALTLEQSTPLYHKIESGQLLEPDADLAADMYEVATDMLDANEYVQYEISNWARRGENNELLACRHNLQYWRTLPYLGLGAAAHGFINHQRTVNVASPSAYIKKMFSSLTTPADPYTYPRTPATVQIHSIDTETEIGEVMMMGLRLVSEGISKVSFQSRFEQHMDKKFSTQIEHLISIGLLEWAGSDEDILRITRKGRLLGNQVFREFI